MSRYTYDSRRYRAVLRHIQATGPACRICGHPGSDSIHHLLPASRFPDLASDPANWTPAHGIHGCPVCRRRCNQEQGASLVPKKATRSRRW